MNRTLRAVLVLGLALACLPSVSEAWWNDDWSFRKRIDVNLIEGVDLQTGIADGTVVVRLHAGNFGYFLDTQSDGADLRFVAADDLTPLEFHIEHYDGISGVAAVWVRVPRVDPTESDPHFWMYYGNESAETASNPAASFDLNHTAVFHFTEASGLPADSTAFGHNATRSSAIPGRSGLIDAAIQFEGDESVEIPATPALNLDPERGSTIAFWVRAEGRGEAGSRILTQIDARSAVVLRLDDLTPTIEIGRTGDAEALQSVAIAADRELTLNRWHHVVLTVGRQLRLWIDGEVAATSDAVPPLIGGPIVLGAAGGESGIRGSVDELRISNVQRSDAFIQFEGALQSADSQVILPGEDESRDSAGGIGQYFTLLWALLGAVRVEGWFILACILVMGLFSADVIINKSSLLRKVEDADADFLDMLDGEAASGDGSGDKLLENSPLANVYRVADHEWQQLKAQYPKPPPQALEIVRAAMDSEIVEQMNRLTSRMVLITIAVSGGPFLGLLGTVVGVMITFATIAAAGDVNVNTIAPGVSAALTTTVMGLLVAIPSLFGYNYVTTRIQGRATAMEVFSDKVQSRYALESIGQNAEPPREVPHVA
ncbi:MAG: DUF2341 domain-containing protein [Pseudomonadota bacterium]